MTKPCLTEFAQHRRELLEQSFLTILEKKPYPEISVKDICQEADIPRRTFYHYFESKEEVLETFIESIMQRCFLEIMYDIRLDAEHMKASFSRVFRFWEGDNRRKLDALIETGLESRLMSHAMKLIRTEKIGLLLNSNLNPKLVEIGLMVGVTDFFSLLFYWSRGGYQETPEEMAEYAIWVLPQAFLNL